MNEGCSGTTNYVVVQKANGDEQRYSSCTALTLNTDDVVKVFTATGGGYGDPRNRSPQQVAADIRNGYLTPERAKEVYNYTG